MDGVSNKVNMFLYLHANWCFQLDLLARAKRCGKTLQGAVTYTSKMTSWTERIHSAQKHVRFRGNWARLVEFI